MIMIQLRPEQRKLFTDLIRRYGDDPAVLQEKFQFLYDRIVDVYLNHISASGTRMIVAEDKNGKKAYVKARLNGRSKKVLYLTEMTSIELWLRRLRSDELGFSSVIYIDILIPYCHVTTMTVAEFVMNQPNGSRNTDFSRKYRYTEYFRYPQRWRVCKRWSWWVANSGHDDWNLNSEEDIFRVCEACFAEKKRTILYDRIVIRHLASFR